MVDSMDITKFAETVLDTKLLEYQKRMIEIYSNMPPGAHIVMGRNGRVYIYTDDSRKKQTPL